MKELENFIKDMPFDPTAPMLTRVVDACTEHQCWRLGEWAAKRLDELSPSVPLPFEIADRTKFSLL
jgi:hypothetical protein